MEALATKVLNLCQKRMEDFTIKNNEIIPRLCPFCNGGESKDEYTFAVSMYNGAYNCKRGKCNKSGTFKSLCEHFGETYESAFNQISVPKKKVYSKPSGENSFDLTDEIITYFAKRKISQKTLEAFNIKSNKDGHIVFPFYRDGELIYEKYRKPEKYIKQNKEPKEWSFKNGEQILFGMDNVSLNKTLYITEGQIDALSLYECGIHNVVSVPGGCSNFEWIELCWDWLENFSQIVLFGDNDIPGIQMVNTIAKRLEEDRCMIVKDYPDFIVFNENKGRQCKDANEILFCYGEEKLKEIAENVEPTPIKGVIDLSTVQYIDPLTQPKIYTRIPDLDKMIGGLTQGGLTVFTGKRGEGKSTLSGQILLNAIQQNKKVCAYSGELSANKFSEWIILQACESKYVSTKIDENTGKIYPYVSREIRERVNEWISNKFYLFDNAYITDEKQTDSIIKVFSMCARRYGCSLFLVDNMMSCLCASAEDEYKAQAKFASALKNFAVKYNAHVILVSHPRKVKAGDKIDNDDVSGSSAITNLADNVIVSEKPNQRVIKNRNYGTTGLIVCDYNPTNRRVYQNDIGDKTVYGWNHDDIEIPECKAEDLIEFKIQSGLQNIIGEQPF